jgi:hypothetical protein
MAGAASICEGSAFTIVIPRTESKMRAEESAFEF